MNLRRFWLSYFIGSVVVCAWAAPGPATLHQNRPTRLDPFQESPLSINPPTFRWPTVEEAVSYRLELSRDAGFKNVRSEIATDSFFRPLEPLEAGRWYWRCRAESPQPGAWMASESFEIGADLPRWPLRDWAEIVRQVPTTHPRLYVRQSNLPDLRENARRLAGELAPWQTKIRAALENKFSLETYVARVPADAGNKKKKLTVWASKAAGIDAATPVGNGAWLWLATGDQWCLEATKQRALMLASLDPAGFTSESTSDFGNAAIVENLGIAYDLLHGEFTAAERQAIRKALVARARPIFDDMARASQQKISGHNWQHIFLNGMTAAVAMLGEEPIADEWLALGLRSFVAMYPWFGGRDGGSQEGTKYYYATEMTSSLDTVDLFQAAFGLRLDEGNPWFRANPYFLIYSFPPNSTKSKIGDSTPGQESDEDESLDIPRGKARLAFEYMAERYGNGHAAAYAASLPNDTAGLTLSQFLRWSKPTRVAPVPLRTLPAARLFRDIGTVYTHSDYERPDQNVRLVFHSDPYGSLGHAHADQNSFHLIAYDEDLLLDSGYYTPAGDPHLINWTRQTKAHNSILVDGTGQNPLDTGSYGMITRFEQNDAWVVMTGSAADAYEKVALARFDRHIVWLKGASVQTYVIIDEIIAADHQPHRLDWLLHAAERMTILERERQVNVTGKLSEARLTFIAPATLAFHQDDDFDGTPAVYWRGEKNYPLPNQWHLKVTPPAASQAHFVTVVQVSKPGVAKETPRAIDRGVEVAGWRVQFSPERHEVDITKSP